MQRPPPAPRGELRVGVPRPGQRPLGGGSDDALESRAVLRDPFEGQTREALARERAPLDPARELRHGGEGEILVAGGHRTRIPVRAHAALLEGELRAREPRVEAQRGGQPVGERHAPAPRVERERERCALHDLIALGVAATFLVPILQRFLSAEHGDGRRPRTRALVLAPTRELAVQIEDQVQGLTYHTSISSVAGFSWIHPW